MSLARVAVASDERLHAVQGVQQVGRGVRALYLDGVPKAAQSSQTAYRDK